MASKQLISSGLLFLLTRHNSPPLHVIPLFNINKGLPAALILTDDMPKKLSCGFFMLIFNSLDKKGTGNLTNCVNEAKSIIKYVFVPV